MPSTLSLTALMLSAVLLSGCTAKELIRAPLSVVRGLVGYVPPPPQTSMLEELNQAYDMCRASGGGDECVREAYEAAQLAKGIEQKPVPKGTVVVREVKESEDEKKPANAAGDKSP